jgi:hypothetical protein
MKGRSNTETAFKDPTSAWHQWLTPVILAEIGRIAVQSQLRQIVPETLSQKYPTRLCFQLLPGPTMAFCNSVHLTALLQKR